MRRLITAALKETPMKAIKYEVVYLAATEELPGIRRASGVFASPDSTLAPGGRETVPQVPASGAKMRSR
jgi:hypothetical protein